MYLGRRHCQPALLSDSAGRNWGPSTNSDCRALSRQGSDQLPHNGSFVPDPVVSGVTVTDMLHFNSNKQYLF